MLPKPARVQIRPIQEYVDGLAFLGQQFWPFVGYCLVGVFIGGAVPVVLFGPLWCGIVTCYLKKFYRQDVSINNLFEGFDQFVDGCLMGIFWTLLCFVVYIPVIVLMIAGMAITSQGGPVALGAGWAVIVLSFFAFNLIIGLMMLGVVFSAGLIIEYKAGFTDAFLLSLKGIGKNFVGAALLVQVSTLIHIVALMLCIVPAFLVLPIITAGHFLSYKKIFHIDPAEKPVPNEPIVVVGQYR